MRNIVIIFLIFTALFAQSNQEFMLKDVSVEGNVVSTANTIIFTSGLRKGAKISSAEFPRAIKRLWQLGLFDDVQIKYDKETDNEVSITIVVLESNIIGNVKYNGNKKIKDSKFKEELDLNTGQRIKPNTIHNTKELIREIYAEKGYLNVDIESQLTLPDDDLDLFGGKGKDLVRDLTFEIKENKKVKIGKIIIEGNKSISCLLYTSPSPRD